MTGNKPRSLLGTGAAMLLVQGGGMMAAFTLSVVLARSLGVTEFGIYSYALSISTLIAVPVQLGLPTLVVRDTARLNQIQQTRQMYRLWSWSTLAVLAASAVMIVPLWLLSPFFISASLSTPLLLMVFALVPLISLGALRAAALRGLGYVVQGQLPEMLFRPALILALVCIAIGFSYYSKFQASTALLMNLVATGLSFLVGLALLQRVAPSSNSGATPRTLHSEWVRAGIVLGVASSAMVVNRNLDMAMLGSMRPATEVGLYKVAINLSMLCATVMNVLQLALQPRIATLHAAGRTNEMCTLVSFAARVSFCASAFLGAVFIVFGRDFIGFAFGDEFSSAYEVMAILIAGQLANSFFGPVMMLLNMTGHEKVVMWSVIVVAAGNTLLNSVLIPIYGAPGAAFATATTLFAWNVILNIQSLRRQGIDSSVLGFHRRYREQ